MFFLTLHLICTFSHSRKVGATSAATLKASKVCRLGIFFKIFKTQLRNWVRSPYLVVLQPVDRKPTTLLKREFVKICRTVQKNISEKSRWCTNILIELRKLELFGEALITLMYIQKNLLVASFSFQYSYRSSVYICS